MKRITGLVLAMVMLMPVSGVRAEEEVVTLTVAQAVELAMANSKQLRIHQSEIEAGRVAIREAEEARRNITRINVSQPNTALLRDGFFVRQAEMNQRLAERRLSDFKVQLELQVVTEYYGLRAAIDMRERAYLARHFANENLWTVNQMLQRGVASFLDSLQAGTAKLRADSEREAARRNVEQARRVLNTTLGLPLSKQLELVDELPVSSRDLPTPDEIMDMALGNMFEVIQAREHAVLAEFALEIFDRHIPTNMFAYQRQAIDTAVALERRDAVVANARLAVHRRHNDMLTARGNVRVARETLEQVHQQYMAAIVRYDVGLITANELVTSLGAWQDAMMGYERAKLDYAVAVANYEILLD